MAARPGLRKLPLWRQRATLIKGQAQRVAGKLKQIRGSSLIRKSSKPEYKPDLLPGRLLLAKGELQNAQGRRKAALYELGIRTKMRDPDESEIAERQKALAALRKERKTVAEKREEIRRLQKRVFDSRRKY